MLRNLYIVFSTIAIFYLLAEKSENNPETQPINYIDTVDIGAIDSVTLAASSNIDSLQNLMSFSEGAVSNKIKAVASTVIGLKKEVVELHGVIKEKDKQIHELKEIVSNVTSSIDSSFKLLAIPEKDRK
jgi:archaellum component FlaC